MAPSTTSALHPIVIPPVQLPPFTTLGTGLLYDSHPRESASTLHTLLLTPNLLENKEKPKSWWRAQCLLYGLDAPEKRTVQELRGTLELTLLKGELVVPVAMMEMEHKENGKFRKLNAQVRDATVVGAGKNAAGKAAQGKAVAKDKGAIAKDTKAAMKDPLKTVKNATKVTKSQPKKVAPKAGAKQEAVTFNLTINMQAARKAGKKAQTVPTKPPAKSQAKKAIAKDTVPKMEVSASSYYGLAGETGAERAKPKMSRGGGAPKPQSRPVKKESNAPRAKQTARCSTRGGPGGKNISRVKTEETSVWPEQEEDYGYSQHEW